MKNNEFIGAAIFPLWHESSRLRHCQTNVPVGKVKRDLSENIVSLLRPHADVPYSLVVSNLSLDGELCLRDDKNAAFFISSPSLAVAGEHGKHHAMPGPHISRKLFLSG